MLTILTEPVTNYWRLKTLAKKIILNNYYYGGHKGVTRSLIEGLTKIGYKDFNYRPSSEKQIGEHVHVLGGVNTLKYAINLKEKKKIKRLTAGPNIVVFPTDADGIAASPAIDLYLLPSQWNANQFMEMEPSLKSRCVPWPAGINISKFSPTSEKAKGHVLIYHKDEGLQFIFRIDKNLRDRGFKTHIITYGSYNLEEYINILAKCEFAVFVSRKESQGICLPEAWAMNVPTICFDPCYYRWPNYPVEYERQGDISTCPYLSEQTGRRFASMDELNKILDNIYEIIKEMKPREWVINNMTDEVCARRFLSTVL